MKNVIYILGVLCIMGAIIDFLTGIRKYKKKIRELERRIKYLTEEITDAYNKMSDITSRGLNEINKTQKHYMYIEDYAKKINQSGDLILASFDSLKVKISLLSKMVSGDSDGDELQKYIHSINSDIKIIEQQINIIQENRKNDLKNNRSQGYGQTR